MARGLVVRVGWLADHGDYVGGAEMTQTEFRAAVPEGVEIIDCPPGSVQDGLDVYAIHNCVSYSMDDLTVLSGLRAVKYHNDVGPWLEPDVRDWLDEHTTAVCCSPLQAEHMGLPDAHLIPPALDLARFEQAASESEVRRGSVCIASWRNLGKGPHRALEWQDHNEPLDFYGDGPFAPVGAEPVPYHLMPALLARYERFIFLPTVLEPFGRLVAEAWAAGCEIVTNELVGALWWIQTRPERLSRAAEDYWTLLLG